VGNGKPTNQRLFTMPLRITFKYFHKILLALAAHIHLAAICHNDHTTFAPDVFGNIFEVDKVRFMWAKEAIRGQHFFQVLKCFGSNDIFPCDKEYFGVIVQ
jgi:hypothetical protein